MTNNIQNRFGEKKIISHQLNFFPQKIAGFADRENNQET